MELELEAGGGGGGGGSRVVSLSGDAPAADLGRGDLGQAAGLPADRTVSRRHVSLRLLCGGEPRLAFEVVGRNPVVVRSADGKKVYRRGEAGELRAGDGLSMSLKAPPSFWAVRRRGGEADVDAAVLDAVARRERRTRERKERRAAEEAMEVTEEEEAAQGSGELDVEVEDLQFDLSSIDPVRGCKILLFGTMLMDTHSIQVSLES